jgi:hypothetical protein
VIGAIVAVACAACAPAKAPLQPQSQPPPDECPAPWPAGESTPEETGRISIRFKNELTRAFGVRRVLIGLDDQPICWKTAPAGGPFLDEASLPVLSGPAVDGEHSLRLVVNVDGLRDSLVNLKGYRFEIKSSHSSRVEAGKNLEVTVIVYEKNDTGPPEERPAIRYTER